MLKKQKFFGVLFCAAAVVAVSALQATAQDVVKISSYADLVNIGRDGVMNRNYELTGHIDASAYDEILTTSCAVA